MFYASIRSAALLAWFGFPLQHEAGSRILFAPQVYQSFVILVVDGVDAVPAAIPNKKIFDWLERCVPNFPLDYIRWTTIGARHLL